MTAPDPSADARLLVTGATGFIGSRLAMHAHRVGFDVLATGRVELDVEHERLDELRSANVRIEPGLLQDGEFVKRIVAGRNVVIHLAAAQHEAEMSDAYFRSINVDAVRILLDTCKDAHISRFVYGSTMGVYGQGANDALDEQTATAPDNIYTHTKLEAEGLAQSYAEFFETCIVRICEAYGPGDFRLLKLFRAIDRGRFFMIGRGDNRRQCIHINDLIRALLLAALHPDAAGEVFIAAGRDPMTTNDMVRDIANALGRPVPRGRAPLWPFAAASSVLETILPPLRIQPPLHSRRLDFFRKSFVFSTAKAQRVLGFTPEIDFLTGAADAVRWYRARGYLQPGRNNEVHQRQSA